MIYKNCRVLPIHNFNEIGITSDLKHLIIDKSEHSEEELKEVWLDILNEFVIINPDQTVKYENQLKERLFNMAAKQSVLGVMMQYDIYSPEILSKLKLNKKSIRQEYNKLRQRSAKLRAKLKIDEQVEQVTNGFEKTLASLTKYYGTKVNRHTTSVSEWLELTNKAFNNV